ncbi:DMT family transporter [Methanospirillum sp.]|uniref:DMT family transporter n=1 Tax=Methanospirillum sp. TaxID=45200 RepID=UPI001BD4B94E|nr:DMT family transporter [Methanospirillum sp.]
MNIIQNPGPVYSQLLIVTGALLISLSPVFVVLSGVSATSSAFYRMALSLPALFLLLFLTGGKLWLGMRQCGIALLAGIFYTLDLTCWHQSILLIGPGLATILGNFQVFVLAAFSVFVLHTRVTLRLILAIPVSIIGLYLICGVQWSAASDDFQLGVILALTTAFWYGGYVLILRMLQTSFDLEGKIANLCMVSIFTTIISGLVVIGSGDTFSVPGVGSWLYLAGYAVICQVIAWILISIGIAHTTPIKVGLILLLQPAGAFIWDIFIFRLPFTSVTLLGVVITLGAIYLGSTSTSPGERSETG